MSYYVDAFPPSVQVAPMWGYSAPYVAKRAERPHVEAVTAFADRLLTADLFSETEGPRAPTPMVSAQSQAATRYAATVTEFVKAAPLPAGNTQESNEIEGIAKQRIRLLAAKYAGAAETTEIVARLEILNRRLSERLPRVSQDQVSALERIGDRLAEMRAAREQRARRLGLNNGV